MKHALPSLVILAALAGCTSPEVCDEPAVKILAAFPGLTYVDGDPEAGTTDMVSLPLLTYRTTEQRGTRQTTRTYVLPLLGRFEQTDRRLQIEWSAAPQDPPQQDGWWGKRRRITPRKPRPASEPEAEPEASERTQPRATPATRPPATRRPATARPAPRPARGVSRGVSPGGARPAPVTRPAPAPSPARSEVTASAAREDDRLVLRLDGAGTVERSLPQQHTAIDLLFPLFALETQRPAVALVDHGGKKAIYKVGKSSDRFRLLPLFSYEDSAERTSFTFWPLFSGYERDASGSYLRLLWFIKIPLD